MRKNIIALRRKVIAMSFVYMVRCSDNSFYTGYAKNVEKRVKEHNNGTLGAKYTKMRRPVVLAYVEMLNDKSSALKREYAIKKLTHSEKEALSATWNSAQNI